jgi:hypothetical protein
MKEVVEGSGEYAIGLTTRSMRCPLLSEELIASRCVAAISSDETMNAVVEFRMRVVE